jgi:Transcriptional regulator
MADKGIQVIDRAFDILEILAFEKDGLGVTEIGNRLGLHKSTVHRILGTMVKRGYIEKTRDRGLYKVGLKLVEISSVYLNSVELKTEARPYLSALMSKLGQPVHLATLDDCDVVYIDKIEQVNSIRLYSQIGRRVPAYCSALGKCLLSGLSDEEIEIRLSKMNYVGHTNYTITKKEELFRQIVEVRRNGWAIDDEEHELGVRCVAAPIFDYRGKVVAAVSLSASTNVFSRDRVDEFAKYVMDTAHEISLRLGSEVN